MLYTFFWDTWIWVHISKSVSQIIFVDSLKDQKIVIYAQMVTFGAWRLIIHAGIYVKNIHFEVFYWICASHMFNDLIDTNVLEQPTKGANVSL